MHRLSCFSCAYGGDLCEFGGEFCFFIMVEHVLQVTSDYEKRLGFFLMYLFCDQANAIRFLREIGLLRLTMLCNTCGRDMTCCADSSVPKGFRWRCHTRFAGVRCRQSVSIKFGSWFQQSIRPNYTHNTNHP